MTDHNQSHEENLSIPELSRLQSIQLTTEDRREIWQGLEHRMQNESSQRNRRSRVRLYWSAATVAAAIAGLVVAYDRLPVFHSPAEPAPNAMQPYTRAPVDMQPLTGADQQKLVRDVMSLASLGRVPDCPYTANQDTMSTVRAAWGRPDRQDTVGRAQYATYQARNFAFGFADNQIFDVRTYAPNVRKVELQAVTAVLGQPDHINTYSDATTPEQDIYIYKAGDQFELQLVFPKVTASQPNPYLDHISVYAPTGAP
ncbi:YjgB family protein [Tumebacillus flagellatus]|nr:YjgB family protein [Tumebacillus flagellatus]